MKGADMKNRYSIMLIVSVFLTTVAVAAFAADKGLAGKDKDFIKKAASGGMMEVEAGTLAQSKGGAQEVKDFGTRMVTDHGKANDELKTLAQQKNVPLPTKLDHKHKSFVDKLQKLSGAAFDKEYMTNMVKDHKNDVEEFRKATQKVKDPEVKGWAEKTLPVLEQHLQQAKEVAQKVGAKVK
jgi:putative membrane protein